jgi:hypothetical protein
MRLVDEITEGPRTRSLPAPSGPRCPTGSVPLTVPSQLQPQLQPQLLPPPAVEKPLGPYLPPVAAKASPPTTGETATTQLAVTTVGTSKTGSSTEAQPKRKRKRLIALAVVVVIPAVAAVVFHDSALVERFTGKGYDTNPLPVHSFPEPKFAGAEYTFTTQSVAMFDGLPTNLWRTEHDIVDYKAQTAKLTIDLSKASIIGGTIGKPQSVTPAYDVFVDAQSSYEQGATPTDPWVRTPQEPGSLLQDILTSGDIRMYQDVIDPTLRAQQPLSVVAETRHEVPVTTYTYSFAFGKFYDSAPRLFDLVSTMDGNAAADATVTVTISLDGEMLVRYLDINVDYQSVLQVRAKKDPEGTYPYRYTLEVVSTDATPTPVSLPTNVVQATTTTQAPSAVTP